MEDLVEKTSKFLEHQNLTTRHNVVEQALSFYRGKRVLVTGHTGFKGSWLVHILTRAGAHVTGYALPAPTEPNLYSLAHCDERVDSVVADVRDFSTLAATFERVQPEVVFHLAAQPIVLESYRDPRTTYDTNVMGTVNVLECLRRSTSVTSFLNVTTDKVYHNNEWEWGYREPERLDGYDPYSNSKSCSELVTHTYNRCFLAEHGVAVSTARAGNVIGGGDFTADRIIPDCVRAACKGETIVVRNPSSVRPYQHVLEPLFCYLLIAARQAEDPSLTGSYNVGPNEDGCVTTAQLVDLFCSSWGDGLSWTSTTMSNGPTTNNVTATNNTFHEANFLRLDISKVKQALGWHPHWSIDTAVAMTCAWSRAWLDGRDLVQEMDRQIDTYLASYKNLKEKSA